MSFLQSYGISPRAFCFIGSDSYDHEEMVSNIYEGGASDFIGTGTFICIALVCLLSMMLCSETPRATISIALAYLLLTFEPISHVLLM